MKPFLRVLLILGLTLAPPAFAASEGDPAPEFTAHLVDGAHFTLSALKGQVVVIHFWASWCEPCKAEMPLLKAFYEKHHAEGLQLLLVNMDDPKAEPAARAMMKAEGLPWTFAKEARFKGWGRIWRLPLTFVIDRQGILRKDGWVTDHALTAADLDGTLLPLLKK